MWIENITGAPGNPVEFINCGGAFVIGNDTDTNADGIVDASRGIEFYNAKFIKVTGTGSADRYGIKIAGTQSGVSGMVFQNLSSDMEVEFTEVTRTGFSGYMAKTDATCTDTDPNSFRGGFVQRNSIFHDNYVHDVKGEGFYLGYSFFQGRDSATGCVGTLIYSHPLVDTKVYNNIVERTGCEGIQLGINFNSEVHHNYVRDYGMDPFANYQNNGVQVGLGTSGRWYNNYIINTDPNRVVGHGIITQGYQDTYIYNNVVVNPTHGIYIHTAQGQDALKAYGPHKLVIANNTIINPVGDPASNPIRDGRAIWSFNQGIPILLLNNLLVMGAPITGVTDLYHANNSAIYDQMQGVNNPSGLRAVRPNITMSGNVRVQAPDTNATFEDLGVENFQLKTGSAAIDAGTDPVAAGFTGMTQSIRIDHAERKVTDGPRVRGSVIDAGAFEL